MDNIETFHHKKIVAAEIVGFIFEAYVFKRVSMILGFGCHAQHWDISQQEKMIAAEKVGFRFEAYLFESVPIFPGFDGLGQHWDVSQSENGRCRNSWFQTRSRPIKIRTEYPRLWLSWTTLRRFNVRKRLLQKPLVSYLKQTFSNQHRCS